MRSAPAQAIVDGVKHIEKHAAKLSPPQILLLTFISMACLGAMLLKLPLATHQPISWMQSLFTAVSATTVTGLIVVDTGMYFTGFGHCVLLALMQGGGLGLMTTGVLILQLTNGTVELRHQQVVREELNDSGQSDIRRMLRAMLLFTLLIESMGAAWLALVWVPELGWVQGLFASIFYAISAFNNAGFVLLPNNLVRYVNHPIINIVIPLLIMTGAIGFAVIYDMMTRRRFHTLRLHTKLMLVGTVALTLISMGVIGMLEWSNMETLGALPDVSSKIWATWFQAVTPRSGGFNTVNINALLPETAFFIIGLMFIGGGSGSTASGIKLSTFLVLLLATRAFLRRQSQVVIFGRSVDQEIILKALSLTIMSFFCVVTGIFLLMLAEEAPFLDIVFEATSAFGTTGLSRGLTPHLSVTGQWMIIILMFIGRVGPLTLIFTLATRHHLVRTSYPSGQVNIG